MRKTILLLLLLLVTLTGCKAGSDASKASFQYFSIGGINIALPPPAEGWVEVGGDNHYLFELFVPESNRLVAAFVPEDHLDDLTELDDEFTLKDYASVQAFRETETMKITSSDFEDLVGELDLEFGGLDSGFFDDALAEINNRLKSLAPDQDEIKMGDPVPLGRLFSKPDAYCFGLLIPIIAGEERAVSAGAALVIRTKNRAFFAYIFTDYQDDSTIEWLHKTSEAWADNIIKANK